MKNYLTPRPLRRLVEDLEEVNMVHQPGTKYGSNPGGIHFDQQGGKHYVKYYRNPDQARVEELSSKIFNHMGIETPGPKVKKVNGKLAVTTPWNDHYKRLDPEDFENLGPEHHKQIARMYHAAVLTKNWDVVGLEHDNIVHNPKTDNLVQVDTGGSFHFRAQGEPKEGGYGDDVKEVNSLRTPHWPSGHVFNHVFRHSPEAMDHGLEAVRNLPMDQIHKDFKDSGLSNWQELHANFTARREKLLNGDH